ncbi:MAG: hypothetical protein AUK03_01630 [Anaerolineae bacterium CG2_30_64_16]|nr:MAG: hypothetical protein AUK03_01630 [Anaerolineae bacterium CG2_30_64_16]
MRTTDFPEYAREIIAVLNAVIAASQTGLTSFQVDQRSMLRGLITGRLLFEDDSELHFREFVDMTLAEPRVMYAYHYQDVHGALIFRYDNAIHHPPPSQAEHKHTPIGITVTEAPPLAYIIDKILENLRS